MNDPNIEQDALNTEGAPLPIEVHEPHKLKSFIATPRTDTGILQRIRSFFTDEMKPMLTVQKGADGLRYMFIITSNSYQDREDETMTSEALKAYEASCYPGDGLFKCDNPLLWWHDDDVPMGEIVAVNYSEPFLIEVARELPAPVAKVLWDYAERQGDKAGASHRFGYREEDRTPNGEYKRIFKQETTYLPERALAANIGTYAGVMKDMSSRDSDKRLDEIFAQVSGGQIQNASAKIHAKTGEIEKELAALGIGHKARKADDPMNPDAEIDTEAVDAAETEAKAEIPADFMSKLQSLMQIYALVMDMVDAQSGMMETELALGKELKALKDENAKEKAYNKTLEERVAILEKRLSIAPRSVTQERGTNPEALKAVVDVAVQQQHNGELVNVPGWGSLKPPIDYSKVTGK